MDRSLCLSKFVHPSSTLGICARGRREQFAPKGIRSTSRDRRALFVRRRCIHPSHVSCSTKSIYAQPKAHGSPESPQVWSLSLSRAAPLLCISATAGPVEAGAARGRVRRRRAFSGSDPIIHTIVERIYCAFPYNCTLKSDQPTIIVTPLCLGGVWAPSHKDMSPPFPSSAYPSPPAHFHRSTSWPSDEGMMGGNTTNVDGVGALNPQRAVDIARNTEGDLDPNVKDYLENVLSEIWSRIQLQPDSYILTKDEFAVFNFYRQRFGDAPEAQAAVSRYWQHTQAEPAASRREETRPSTSFNPIVPLPFSNSNATMSVQPTRSATHQDDEQSSSSISYPHSPSHASGASAQQNGSAMPPFLGAARAGTVGRLGAVTATLASLVVILTLASSLPSCAALSVNVRSLPHYARAATASLLEVFQVYPPVLTVTPNGVLEITDGSSNATVAVLKPERPTCQKVLAVHSFANSYGHPFVGNYTPPPCDFNRVTWNLTVVSAGRQYDRLAIVYLGSIEVFRTSTAEPSQDGVEWTYLKDMTSFLSLFKQDQTLIFDLGNEIEGVLTGAYNVTLTAAFFTAEDSITPADKILPISPQLGSQDEASVFTVPPDTASSVWTLPRNVKKAVFTIAATGQIDEEFWWSNVLQSEIDTFPSEGLLYGYSPFREVQLFIDGMLAGVAWPFPIIFTGGIVPGLWRPIVGIDAFDLKEDEIDITPWLPLLCDGTAHNYTIRVSGLNDNGNGSATLSETTDGYWLVTGKIFLWLDQEGHVTTGDGPYKNNPEPKFEVSSYIGQSANGTNETLIYQVNAQRSLSFHSTLNLASGKEEVFWEQSLTYSNFGNYSDQGNLEINSQQTTGYDRSSSGYARHFSYPLYADLIYSTPDDNISYVATVKRGKDVQTLGEPVFPTGLETFSDAVNVHNIYPQFQGASLSTTQNGNATYLENQITSAAYSWGTTEQDMEFSGIRVDGDWDPFPSITYTDELFHRSVVAVNNTITEDDETLVGETVEHPHPVRGVGRGFTLQNVPGHGSHWHDMQRRRRA